MPIQRQQGFTLTEIIVVIIILGIIAAFTIPNYRKSYEAEFERTGRFQLESIYKAEQIYRARAKDFWPAPPDADIDQDADAINDALKINITEEGMTYNCRRYSGTDDIKCTAERKDNSFRIGVCVNINDAICCDTGVGTCPTASLPACGC